jgi:sigma-E factor negative regulatory protein RseC
MEQLVRVKEVFDNGTADVILVRESACSGDCHKCSGCGAAKQSLVLTAENPIGARVGDMVVISSDTGPVLKAAAVLYLLPLVLFLAGYLLGAVLWQQGAITGVAALILGVIAIKLYDKHLSKKEIVYTITSFAGD